MERNFAAEAAEMQVSEDDRWEYARWQWEREHEGEWDNYVPDEHTHACEWCGADVADEYEHLCPACERSSEVMC